MFTLYHFINKLFAYLKDKATIDTCNSSKIDKLFEKMDRLVDSNFAMTKEVTKALLTSSKDVSEILNTLAILFESVQGNGKQVL